jgi:predicted outer membrane repeat protein
MKSPMTKGIAIIGSSGLVIGLGITGSGSARANGDECTEGNTVRAVEDQATENTNAIQLKIDSDVAKVCLEGNFEINGTIFFDAELEVIGRTGSSITTAPGFTYAVFETEYPDATITIRNVDINSSGRAIYGYGVQVHDSTFTGRGDRIEFDGGAIMSMGGQVAVSNSVVRNYSSISYGGAVFAFELDIENSEFSNNSASESGGAVFSIGPLVIENSEFSNNSAVVQGGAVAAVEVVNVTESLFLENTADYTGGAIAANSDVTIGNSTLSNNESGLSGGAVHGTGLVSATGSLFSENKADLHGGAIYADPDDGTGVVEIANSTFYRNEATGTDSEGGAIFAHSGYTYFSTFVSNSASPPGLGDTPGNAIYKTYFEEFRVGANIFTHSDPTTSEQPQLGFGGAASPFTDDGGNVFSTSESTESDIVKVPGDADTSKDPTSIFGVTINSIFGTNSPVLATYQPNTSNTQTIGLAAGSPAIGIVPNRTPFNSYTLDQRGATRIDPRDAGAFQGVAPVGGGGSSVGGGYSADFTIFSLPIGITKPGADVKVDGANLNLVKEVYVNGVKVKLKEQSAASLVFTAPRGLIGVVDVRFLSATSQYNAFRALDFGSSAASSSIAITVVGGFAANSTRLSVKMKREIRAFLKSNPGFSTVTCIGFTSEPATAMDSALAKARGQVTCNFVKKIDSELKAKVVQGRHTEQPGSKIRRVRITLE